MQKCKACNHPFTFSQVFRSFWRGYATIECQNCHTHYEHRMKNRLLGGLAVGGATLCGLWVKSILDYNWPEGMVVLLIVMIIASLVFSAGVTFFFSFERSGVGQTS